MDQKSGVTTTTPPAIPLRALGASGIHIPALGVGTNRWGFRKEGADRLTPVYSAALDAGANLFDTAEVYLGSEKAIGDCIRHDPRPVYLVSKFAPYPTRLSFKSFHKALEGTLTRLGIPTIDLYLIHFPFSPMGIASLMDVLAEVARAGIVRAVGVSNFSTKQMYFAANQLERHGIPLAANEVHFSIFHRDPERNGILEACRKLDVTLIAYRPLAGGRNRQNGTTLDRALAGIAIARQKTAAQVALNWLLHKDEHIVAIPGTTNVVHLRENIGAIGWVLNDDELTSLEQSSARL